MVITGRDGKEVEKHISKLRVICLRNEDYENTQMFDSIGMGLRYIEDLCDRILILPPQIPHASSGNDSKDNGLQRGLHPVRYMKEEEGTRL